MMAADSLSSYGGTKHTGRKLYRVRGAIIGTSGDAEDGVMFAHWYSGGADLSDRPQNLEMSALVLDGSGIWLYESYCYPHQVLDEFMAIGSGRDAALAAMHMGATPEEAVRVASEVDIHTGPPVVAERLDPPKAASKGAGEFAKRFIEKHPETFRRLADT